MKYNTNLLQVRALINKFKILKSPGISLVIFLTFSFVHAGAQENILNIKYDSIEASINKNIYGQFLEHIYHSTDGGLYAERLAGQGFEGDDFDKFWDINFPSGSKKGDCLVVDSLQSVNGKKYLSFTVKNNSYKISQKSVFFEKDYKYSGYLWIKTVKQLPMLTVSVKNAKGEPVGDAAIKYNSSKNWQKVNFEFTAQKSDTTSVFSLSVVGNGTIYIDFISVMRADERENGMLRADLYGAVKDLAPPFIRWPGGSYVSDYHWQDGIGDPVTRQYRLNRWGYFEYNGFGTEEFMELCRRLNSEPLIVMNASLQTPKDNLKRSLALKEGLNQISYLNDNPTSEWGKIRAKNGHPEPYGVKNFQVDNEPMNYRLSGNEYGSYVAEWGPKLREIKPAINIFAAGNKRSYDVEWSRQVIEKAGKYIDYLGLHNYEYTREGYQLGIRRIESYLYRVKGFIENSENPKMKLAILEWGITTPDDWRSGLHTAGMYILYEKFAPLIEMSCPALFIRRIGETGWGKDAIINQNFFGWYPAPSYTVTKLFRENYAPYRVASMCENYMDAIVTLSEDRLTYIIKAVNYSDKQQTFTLNFRGNKPLNVLSVTRNTIKANLTDTNSLKDPGFIAVVKDVMTYSPAMRLTVEPYSVIVLDIKLNK
jgi:alpha-N-arabinofuranosidase